MIGPDLSVVLPVSAIVIEFIVRVVAVIVVPPGRRPTTALAWLMAIFLIPYLGVLLFLIIGSNRLPRRRRRKQDEINRIIRESMEGVDRVAPHLSRPQWFESVVTLNRNLGAMPLVGGNDARLHGDYEATIRAMGEEIDRARRYVHCEFYILAADATTAPFFDALDRAVARGVTVRILLDHIASIRVPGYFRGTYRRLRSLQHAGAQWAYMLPVRPWRGQYQRPDLRNHRKLLIVDGTAAFMGSQNVVDSSYNKRGNIRRCLHWRDLMVRLEGPIVQGINAIFITDWYSETDELLLNESEPTAVLHQRETIDCQVVPSGPGFVGENNLRLFLTLLYSAQKSIIITSPYFVPDEAMLYAITTATRRGVHVELFVSETGDQAVVYHAQRSYYEALLIAGVRIWMYRTPTILHAKHVTIDDDVAVIGSSNMDMRSFTLNLEVSLMVRGSEFVEDLREVQQDYREHSRELSLREWQQQPLRSTLLDNLARLTSALQ